MKTHLHNLFLIIKGDPVAQPYTLKQAKAMAMTALDIMTNPDLAARMKEDFSKDLEER